MRSPSLSPSPRRHTCFCGIDIAKDKHVACIIDRDGKFVARSQSFTNNAEGYQQILGRLQEAGGPAKILVGMEATGHYWYSLHDFLDSHRYGVVVLNPVQTAQQAKKGIRKTQTDKIDARHIATLLKNGDGKPALIPGEFGRTCRQLTRLHRKMVRQQARIKQLIWSWLHPVWPEYEALFTNPFSNTGRALLHAAPTPPDVLNLPQEGLVELIRKASRGRFGSIQAVKIRKAAENSVGTPRMLEPARIAIRSLLDQIAVLEPIREQLENQVEALRDRLPAYLLTLPGIGTISAVSLFGETDPIDAFGSPAQLVAFAGLDLVVSQSGKPPKEKPAQHISKRGSPSLRYTIWMMAQQACFQDGDLRNYYLRRRAQGLGHLATVTAAAIKLCHVIWRIMIDRRDYLPQRTTTKP
jgi:transposase